MRRPMPLLYDRDCLELLAHQVLHKNRAPAGKRFAAGDTVGRSAWFSIAAVRSPSRIRRSRKNSD
jgi:hypothetical protein